MIRINVLETGVVCDVHASKLAKEVKSFSPGDTVRRAMFNGTEETATVKSIDSGTHCTVSIHGGATYSSDMFRLRKIASASETNGGSPTVTALDIASLESRFRAKVPTLSSSVKHNPWAAPGTRLHSRFVSALTQAADREVDVFLHGSPESNVNSILSQSLLAERSRDGYQFWFTDHIPKAMEYAGTAKRMVAFAILKPRNAANPVEILSDPAHHLPLFEVALK